MGCRSTGTESRLVSVETDGVAFLFPVQGRRDVGRKTFQHAIWNVGQQLFHNLFNMLRE
jgi:hypothetical protein